MSVAPCPSNRRAAVCPSSCADSSNAQWTRRGQQSPLPGGWGRRRTPNTNGCTDANSNVITTQSASSSSGPEDTARIRQNSICSRESGGTGTLGGEPHPYSNPSWTPHTSLVTSSRTSNCSLRS